MPRLSKAKLEAKSKLEAEAKLEPPIKTPEIDSQEIYKSDSDSSIELKTNKSIPTIATKSIPTIIKPKKVLTEKQLKAKELRIENKRVDKVDSVSSYDEIELLKQELTSLKLAKSESKKSSLLSRIEKLKCKSKIHVSDSDTDTDSDQNEEIPIHNSRRRKVKPVNIIINNDTNKNSSNDLMTDKQRRIHMAQSMFV
jgi:hypothetical protein